MLYDHYLIAPEFIKQEIEHAVSVDTQYKGIKLAYFTLSPDISAPEIILRTIRKLKCDNDILLLCDRFCPEVAVPEEYYGSLRINKMEHIYDLFAQRAILQRHEEEGTFVIVSGWLEMWQNNLKSMNLFNEGPGKLFHDSYSSILILDTGIHHDVIARAEEFFRYTGVPFKILNVGFEHFKMVFDNMMLRWVIEKKQGQLKVCNKKVASYAMSLDFIKTIADITDESTAIDSVCKLFSTMFAPKNVVYYSFHEDDMELIYCKCEESKKDTVLKLKGSDADYVVFDKEDGFAIKISTTDDILGIIEVHGIAFPKYLDEYLSVAHDLAKASGLAISNIRRYHEVSRSREEHVKLTEMLRTTNRILRHDIANDLQIVLGALDLLEEKNDKQFILMIRKAANKSVSLIRNVQELDQFSVGVDNLELLNLRNLVDSVISKHVAEFNVTGNCIAMADKALSSVLDNIISNAIIHGSASKIEIGIVNKNDTCEVSIADNGTGIPDDIKPLIFDEGYKHGKTGNTGFGLYIAKKTIERYNGFISVEDNFPKGTKFIIRLAAAQVLK
ncbi:ATP-binding protein [Methanolobus psychrotolerans]|uniref:ATP-binding protein n=1 Tax=Methanolobus psychrotolerans TaxID=1874706 RepID=UPI0013EAA4D9|nr:ATP-binding protein [Methanolobus psychrotolerans]